MKEVKSQSPWVGKVVTCRRYLRSFEIQEGDQICGGIIPRFEYFVLKCGHLYTFPTGLNQEKT